jgi:cytochrome c553
MIIRTKHACAATFVAALQLPYLAGAAAPSDLAQLDFFEKKIRPVLAESCYECHSASAKKLKGGLYLDTADGLVKGGDSGPGIVPGNPAKSLLLITMRHEDKDPDMAMPPKKDKLSDAVIADFEQWIKMGAPDPRTERGIAKSATWDAAKAKDHWAFQKISNPPVPKPADAKHFVQNPIDNFVLAKLDEKKLTPSAKADKHTLIRRVTYDLIGLPPTPQEVDAFLADNSPNAFEKVVDRLLASPRYGERWGRHWLDISRYADTSGDRQGGGKRQPIYSHAWTYRDYVIDSFNRDLPYDKFIVEQIAADRLPEAKTKVSKLAALGFLTVGKRFMGNANDMVDDQIDVVTKGVMGITGACARCHDHKFDPIPTKDYYSLYGVFTSSQEVPDGSPLSDPEKNPRYKDFLEEVAKVDKELEQYSQTEAARLLSGMLEKAGDYMLAAHEAKNTSDSRKKGGNFRLAARDKGLKAELAAIWLDRMKTMEGSKKNDPVFGPWVQFAELPADKFAASAPALAKEIAASPDVTPAIAKPFAKKVPTSLKDVAAIYTEAFATLHTQLKLDEFTGYKGGGKRGRFDIAKTQVTLADADMAALRKHIYSDESAILPGEQDMQRALGNQFSTAQNTIRNKVVNLELSHPGAPVKAMSVMDRATPRDAAVLVRGEPQNRGAIVPRQFPAILTTGERKPFTDGSGRLEMAKLVASRDNPLTARVIVNRVWQWHFGQAIVRTVSDFGTRSEPPTHPEMLDYLATWLMDNGWSLKKLNKFIVMSATYQQDSRANPEAMKSDPTNQWLWRTNIQRLDFEQVRDSLLTFGSKLDLTMGGQPYALTAGNGSGRGKYGGADLDSMKGSTNRRTVYAFIDRSALPEMFNTFDFANPDMSTGERIMTTVPQQALFMMNSPFLVDQVKNILARPDIAAAKTDAEKVRLIFRTLFQRAPSAAELKLAEQFLTTEVPEPKTSETSPVAIGQTDGKDAKKTSTSKMTPLNQWERYTQVVLLTNELIFVN